MKRILMLVLVVFSMGCSSMMGVWSPVERYEEYLTWIKMEGRPAVEVKGFEKIIDLRRHEWDMRYCQKTYLGATIWAWEQQSGQWKLGNFTFYEPTGNDKITVWVVCMKYMLAWPGLFEQEEIKWLSTQLPEPTHKKLYKAADGYWVRQLPASSSGFME